MTEALAAPPTAVSRQSVVASVVAAWLLLAACLALLVTGLVAGERESTYDELRHAVATGEVDSVVVIGGSTAPYRGRMEATVHWRDGLVRHFATVIERHPQRRTTTASGVPVVHSVESDLAELGSDVAVERRPHDYTAYSEINDWRLPPWTGPMSLGIVLVALVLLVGGRQPRRATRWAWFWLLGLAPPLGLVAFLVLSGALSWRPRTELGPRLTGGWAFLLVIVVSSALSAIGDSVL